MPHSTSSKHCERFRERIMHHQERAHTRTYTVTRWVSRFIGLMSTNPHALHSTNPFGCRAHHPNNILTIEHFDRRTTGTLVAFSHPSITCGPHRGHRSPSLGLRMHQDGLQTDAIYLNELSNRSGCRSWCGLLLHPPGNPSLRPRGARSRSTMVRRGR